MDATNVFNYLNRLAALRNIPVLCPFARILINTYQKDSKFYIDGDYILLNKDGNSLAMPMLVSCGHG